LSIAAVEVYFSSGQIAVDELATSEESQATVSGTMVAKESKMP